MGASILVVDDHPGFRVSVRRLLELEGYRVVGEAADGATAVDQARRLRPEIALVDVHLPDIDGFEVSALLTALAQPPQVILTSSRDCAECDALVAACGARGFVPKDQLSSQTMERFLQ